MDNPQKIFKKTVCPLDCPDTCGLVATVVNGRVTQLNGDPDHPFTKGVICRKMKNYHERLYSDNRILHPMMRTGQKGEGSFKKISWDEAYALLKEKIQQTTQKYGGESILPFVYAGNMGLLNRFAGYPLFHKLGTTKLEETICSAAAKAGWRSCCGDVPGSPPERAEDAQLIIIWGGNTKVTNMHFWPIVARARKKGAILVVIDPYRNITASSADLYLQVEPGGDSALAFHLLKMLQQKGALDHEFIRDSTEGFDSFTSALGGITEGELKDIHGVNQDGVKKLAGLLSETNRVFLRVGIGMTRNSRAGNSIQALTSLGASLGLFGDGVGKGVLLSTNSFKGDQSLLVYPELQKQKGRRFNMVQLGHCLSTASPPIKMLVVYNSNPLGAAPDSSLIRKAMASEDLFTVVHEQVMTATARYADLLLPATTFLENRDAYTSYGHFYLNIAEPVVDPCGEAKSNFTFFQELATHLGFEEPPFHQSGEERLQGYLESLDGLKGDILKRGIKPGEPQLSERYNERGPIFHAEGMKYHFPNLEKTSHGKSVWFPEMHEFNNPDLQSRYPFKLITPPHIDLLNTTFGERYEGSSGYVLIHPDDAVELKVQQGETVTLYNDRGWNRRVVKITDATRQGLLVAEGLFWQSDDNPSTVNDLTSQKLTDMGGGGTFHESRVAVIVNSRESR